MSHDTVGRDVFEMALGGHATISLAYFDWQIVASGSLTIDDWDDGDHVGPVTVLQLEGYDDDGDPFTLLVGGAALDRLVALMIEATP